MDINRLKNVTDVMLKNFVDKLGLDGDAYVSTNNCPIVFGDLTVNEVFLGQKLAGKFFTPKSKELEIFLDGSDFSPEEQKKYFENGLIVLSDIFTKKKFDDKVFLIVGIHERLHSGRMILTDLPYSGDEDIPNYFHDKGRFVKNSEITEEKYVDPAQEVLLDSIDQSKKVVSHYYNLTFDEKDDLQFANSELDDKIDKQKEIDEALIDLMAITAYTLSTENYSDIMDVVDYISENYKDNDAYHTDTIRAMSNIVLRHNDLELFKWMLDPLAYQVDDIHYDYFSHYVNSSDSDDIDTIFKPIGIGEIGRHI